MNDQTIIALTARIESLEQTRAIHADVIHHLRSRIDTLAVANTESHADRQAFAKSVTARFLDMNKRLSHVEHLASDATRQFELTAEVLEKLARDSIAHGVSADQRESHTIKAFAVVRSMLDELRRTLGAINKSSAANASLSNDMDEARDDIKEIRVLLDQHATTIAKLHRDDETIDEEMHSRTDKLMDRTVRVEKLAADLREAFNVAIGDIPTKPEPEFVHYTHAEDLAAVIREAVTAAVLSVNTRRDANAVMGYGSGGGNGGQGYCSGNVQR